LPTLSRKIASIRKETPGPALSLEKTDRTVRPSHKISKPFEDGKVGVKPAAIPIPFHKFLKVVAIVDAGNPQIRQLLDRIGAENFKIEVSDNFDRDISEDAAVGAYIAMIDGDRLERARSLARAVRSVGFRTPLWGLADSHRISDISSFDFLGEVTGYIYLGQQTPAFYAKQVIGSLIEYGMALLPPFFGGLMAYDAEANIAFDCPGHQGGQFYRKSPAGQLFFKHFGEQIFRNDLCNADVDLGDLLIHVGAAVEAQRHAAQVFGADRTYFVLNGNICALLAAKNHINIFIYDPIVDDPHGIINQGHDNKTARNIQVGKGDKINEKAMLAMFRGVIANNRKGGWRKLKTG